MDISIAQIKSLRDRTGISMTAVKKALVEAGGDEEAAIELLRKKGAAKASERQDRDTAHGVVAVAGSQGKAALLAVGCETDFVAKNDDFVKQVQGLADKLLAEGVDADFSNEINELNIQMGEKIEIVDKVLAEGANVASYIHSNNRIGVLISLSGGEEETGQDIAMHIAAMNPKVISPNDVSDDAVEKEKAIWIEQLKNEGKPENIIENILKGKEKKFREESALVSQPFVKNSEQSIQDVLGDITVENFWRFEV